MNIETTAKEQSHEITHYDTRSTRIRAQHDIGLADMALLMSPAPISLGQVDTRTLLDRMGALRLEAERVQRHLHVGSIPHRRLTCLMEDIDENAMLLTGDRRHFQAHAPRS